MKISVIKDKIKTFVKVLSHKLIKVISTKEK